MATAVDLIREQGLRQLSMRPLAERLGATPMAVYKHVDNRDTLALLAVEAILQTLTLPEERLEPVAWLRQLAGRLRALGLAHRGVMEFLLDEGPVAHTSLVILDRTVRKLHDAGLPWKEAGALHNTFFSWLAGAVRRQEPWELSASGTPPPFQRFFDAAAALPASDYPGIAHSLPHMRATEVEREFEASLDFMLEGIQRRIDARRGPARKRPRSRQG
ncbi:TetR/AcrR family transcriptional regulator [Pyxidicoccus xibeiensis]|uniref:TetR/AcrR family transcriptional regulator n=1 Tax=Pyxidicoccus xibeiensis TaxID=2906759 RepID=UPI0020A73601|nr:TetR/AcrR family transcriptional regulator C-terminal domain-containing protein [Pyxidicoccus xibeiensis]MCP3143046.1 TetR/AcrR family transcriptional regulator [Pyxidicoccus xibeiensis]